MLIKFRAECQRDVDRFLKIIPKDSLISYKITKLRMPNKDDGRLLFIPDVDCEFDIENWSIPGLIDLLSHVPDSHVIQQTLTLAENYTGDRNIVVAVDHKERHVLLHKMLDELAADYLSHKKKLLQNTSIFDLMDWSYQQTMEPDE